MTSIVNPTRCLDGRHVSIRTSVHVSTHMSTHLSVHMSTHMFTHMPDNRRHRPIPLPALELIDPARAWSYMAAELHGSGAKWQRS